MENELLEHQTDEMDLAYESVLDYAMEGQVINKETRDRLPDDAFGLPSVRKYPLIVKSNKVATEELIGKAVQFFHFCRAEWRKELAENIVKAIKKTHSNVKISEKSQICKYTTVPKNILTASAPPKVTK